MPATAHLSSATSWAKLTTLVVVCDKCGRHSRYNVDRLIAQHGANGKMTDWHPEGDCPKRRSPLPATSAG
jgi:RNase P subunit RPR2